MIYINPMLGEKMFTDKEKLLADETHLTKSLLSTGLHALKRADLEHKGLFFLSFHRVGTYA